MHDVVIRDASIVDGTGAPAFRGSVAIDGARIAAVGLVPDQGAREIDAEGRVVCPGFIDVHTHSDLMLLAEPAHEPKVRQGVTTDLLGLDGIGYAPLADHLQPAFRDYFAALNGDPPISRDWSTVAGWLDTFESAAACNVAHHVPHGCVRAALVGWEDRQATPDELRAMQQITHEAFQDGAVALSTGLDYKPCAFADTDELVALSEVAAQFGAPYVPHMRYVLGMRDAIRETMAIGRRAGCPVHISHYISGEQQWWVNLDEAERGMRAGVSLSFDTYAYPAGSSLLHFSFPDWALEGGPQEMLRRLEDADTRARIAAEMANRAGDNSLEVDRALLSSMPAGPNRHLEGRMLSEVADEQDQEPHAFLVDLVREERGRAASVFFNDQTDDDFAQIMRHPGHMVGSDAILLGDSPHPRTYGTYPRFLGRWVRERQVVPLEAMVRRMTGMPAARFGLVDRGALAPGMAADVVVFDPDTVIDNATFEAPRRLPTGIDYVIVNGTAVIDDGRHTGATPGRPLRRGRAAQ